MSCACWAQMEQAAGGVVRVIGFNSSCGAPCHSRRHSRLRKQRSLLSESLVCVALAPVSRADYSDGESSVCDSVEKLSEDGDGDSYAYSSGYTFTPESSCSSGNETLRCWCRSRPIDIPWSREVEKKMKEAAVARQRRACTMEDLQRARFYFATQQGQCAS